jgi:atypical dual specificity phosphatase
MLDIESGSFSWDDLSSLHHTEHSSSNEHSEDEMNKALEVHQFSTLVMYTSIYIKFSMFNAVFLNVED